MNYGKIFAEASKNAHTTFFIITHSSRIKLDEGELWITRSITDIDQVYVVKGSTKIILTKGIEQHIEMGEMLIINGSGEMATNKITKKINLEIT